MPTFDDAGPDVGQASAHGYPARAVLDRISDRWSIAVMRALQTESPLRYSELAQRLPGVSRKMLTQTLRAIERDGMVRRTVYPEVPPRVEYAATQLGLSSLGPIDVLCDWSSLHMDEVLDARRRYDASRAGSAGDERDPSSGARRAPAPVVRPTAGRSPSGSLPRR